MMAYQHILNSKTVDIFELNHSISRNVLKGNNLVMQYMDF
jgi:hypothetical protein